MRKPGFCFLAGRRVRGCVRSAVLGLGTFVLAGCSTPGPLHLYSIAPGNQEVHDLAVGGTDVARAVPSYLGRDDRLTGFAYDPFTDHFFLRLAPGNHIRVVDRPARKIKREFVIDAIPADGGGDLAVSPRSGHMYLVDPHAPAVLETTRFGKLLARITLAGRATAPAAIAFDMTNDYLIALDDDGRSVERYTARGEKVGVLTLEQKVGPSLAYDSTARELYAPLTDPKGKVGVFDATGRCVRTIDLPTDDRFIDVGPHSFLRVF